MIFLNLLFSYVPKRSYEYFKLERRIFRQFLKGVDKESDT